MKIDFAGTPLCTAEMIDSPDGFTLKKTRNVQPKEALRAPATVMIDRFNKKCEVAFTICRSHDSIVAAEDFALTHEEDLPSNGMLTLTADDGSHSKIKARYVPSAVLESVAVKYKGMLSWATYQFVGGQVLTTKPT